MLESASPRKPKEWIFKRSSTLRILLVEWRKKAIGTCFLIPGLSAVVMGAAVWGAYKLTLYLFRVNALATIISILVGACVYAVVLLLLHGMTEEEIRKFPKGYLLVRIVKKMHLLH